MSVIEKLLIRGIRSFDPEEPSVIEFYSPLTLIVGRNGSGKTTIIECLKYATTGELPPNSKGGAFVHDPKLAGETAVKAQVKLKFKNINNKDMVCTRSLQVTQKKTTVSMQTLEGVLYIAPNKETGQEKISISTKCAELDVEMPLQLGISKAILENVIFCHQEDSNWPLSEPVALKKRFDDIFSATRYTKAVDALKKLRKDQAVDFKILSNDLKHLEENKRKSDKIKREISGLLTKSDEIAEEIKTLQADEKSFQDTIDEFSTTTREFLDTDAEMLKTLHEKNITEKNLNETTEHLEILDLSIDELEKIISEQETEKNNLQKTIDNLNSKISMKVSKVNELQTSINENQINMGKYEILQNTFNNNVKRRSDICSLIYSENREQIILFNSQDKLDASSENLDFENKCLAETIYNYVKTQYEYFTNLAMQDNGKLNRIENEFLSEKNDFNILNAEKRQLLNQLDIQKGQKHNEIAKLEGLIQDQGTLQAELLSLKNSLGTEKIYLADSIIEREKLDFATKSNSIKSELELIDEEVVDISCDSARAQSSSELIGKSELILDSINAKTKSLDTLITKLGKYVLDDPKNADFKDMRDDIKNQIKDLDANISSTSSICRDLDIELASKKDKLASMKDNLTQFNSELADLERDLIVSVTGNEYEAEISSVQKNVEKVSELIAKNKSITVLYKSFFDEVMFKQSCPLCFRSWDNPDDKEKFTESLKTKIMNVPSSVQDSETELVSLQGSLNKLKSIQPSIYRARNLRDCIIPELVSSISDLSQDILTLSSKTAEKSAENKDLENKKADLSETLKLLEEIINLSASLKTEKDEYNKITIKINTEGSTKSSADYAELLNNLQKKSRELRTQLDLNSQKTLEIQKKISKHENNISQYQNQIQRIEQKISLNSSYLQKKNDLFEETKEIKKRVVDILNSIEIEEKSFESKESEYLNSKKSVQLDIDLNSSKSNEMKSHLDNLSSLNNDIAKSEEEMDIQALFASTKANIDELKSQIHTINGEIDILRVKLSDNEIWKNNYEQKVRKVHDNIKVKKLQDEILSLDQTIEKINLKKVEMNDAILGMIKLYRDQKYISFQDSNKRVKKSEADDFDTTLRRYCEIEELFMDSKTKNELVEAESLSKKRGFSNIDKSYGNENFKFTVTLELINLIKSKLRSYLDSLATTKASLIGEKKQIETQIQHFKNDIKANYKDIDSLYIEKMIAYKSLELAQEDLEKYSKGLDNAIMMYHSMKMQEINKIIRELWVNTYMADDIDTIEIRSESEKTKLNRSYNYRVVMIKGGQVIDMRGRCSAGQKLLAALIIRLALAETFAMNCGILALDEPTTNLDEANIESLARSLSRIIASRQYKSKFQFVIITHDEEFLNMLGKSDLTDYYWKVYKNQK
ncbi:hypothetical protein BB560_003635 [Smittium megazygosporum]|uniref:DNA repair protein RAD50 n=1 Tax=Smittium megazygosporum TaxID=133381 RepID=A0A2T9ZBI4_9FUNG|nr:hypothetical protein BB560_003635 [Smittium megazygosporum]